MLFVGSTEENPDIEYFSGFRAADPVVLVLRGKQGVLIVPELERGRAQNEAKNVEVATPQTLGLSPKERGSLSAWAEAGLKRLNAQAATVQPKLYVAIADKLRQRGFCLSVAKQPAFAGRAVKSLDEVRKITQAQQAAVIAMRAAMDIISRAEIDSTGTLRIRNKKLTSESIKTHLQKILLDHNCICRDIIVAGGSQSANPHETGSGNLLAGEPIVMDIFPRHLESGYWGDLTRTVVRGRATPFVRKMYQAVKAAHHACLEKLKPGVSGSTVHAAAVKEFAKKGFGPSKDDDGMSGFIHSTGHGVGLEIHELPSLSPSPRAGKLKVGNVVTVEPGLYYPDIGGIRIEDTVLITPDGWRYLVPCEKRFEL